MLHRLRFLRSNPQLLQGIALGILAGMGLVVRMRAYWFNRSLWYDEAVMANYVIQTSLADLIFSPAAAGRLAPTGFLAATKILVSWISESEKVLRILPVSAGVLMILLALWIALRVFEETPSRFAFVGLVAFSPILVFYNLEFKQYILDACLSIFILGIGIRISQLYFSSESASSSQSSQFAFALAAIGILGIWFSHPLVFTLFGVGLGLFIQAVFQPAARPKQRQHLFGLFAIGLCWLVSFLLSYWAGLHNTIGDQELHSNWSTGFAPFPLESISEMHWFLDTILASVHLAFQEQGVAGPFDHPGWYQPPNVLLAILCVSGFIWLAARQKWLSVMLSLTTLAALLASILGLYPLRGRLILFTVPFVYLSTSAVVEVLSKKRFRIAGSLLTLGLVAWVLWPTSRTFARPTAFEEVRDVLHYLAANYSPGEDRIAISQWSLPAYNYYKTRFGLLDLPVYVIILAPNDPQDFLQAVCASSKPGKMWLLFSHSMEKTSRLLDPLRALTPQITQAESVGAGVYFFNFSDPDVCQSVSPP